MGPKDVVCGILFGEGALIGVVITSVISSFLNLRSIAEAVFYIWDEVKKRLKSE